MNTARVKFETEESSSEESKTNHSEKSKGNTIPQQLSSRDPASSLIGNA